MKPQTFLREMSNYVFKQFCSELDDSSLANLIQIVSTPNERATDMINAGSDDEVEEGEVAEAYGSEVSDDSDDL